MQINQYIFSDLEHIEIWHDGEGRAPDWDLKRIILTDQLTGKKYEFMFIEKNKFTTIKKGTIYSSVANGKLTLSSFQSTLSPYFSDLAHLDNPG